jgi:small subunit ribosomal protein S20
VLSSISDKNAEQSKSDYITAVSCIDKLVAKGLIHKNKAARHKSRLNSKIKSL